MSIPVRTLLDQVVSDLDQVLSDDRLAGLGDAERVEVLAVAGAAFRRVEAVVVETVAGGHLSEFPHAAGCRSQNELLQRAIRTDVTGATRFGKVIDLVRRDMNLSGERMPAAWPALRDALLEGEIGVAGMLSATKPVEKIAGRISVEDRWEADEFLARAARGLRPDPDGVVDDDVDAGGEDVDSGADADGGEERGPAPTPEDLRWLAEAIARSLDPDGDAPEDEPATRRGLTLGRVRDGLRHISGHLTPEVAAQLELLFDAYNNPKGDGPPQPGGVRFTSDEDGDDSSTDPDSDDCSRDSDSDSDSDSDVDESGADQDRPGSACDDRADDPFNTDPRAVLDGRSASQKRHDAFAAILGIAARHDSAPTIGGASPTLVVTIDVTDLDPSAGSQGVGWGSVPGAFGHVHASAAAHVGCTGTIQRVFMDQGRIIGISTTNRVFTVHQRRAIIARDKECLIPGCHVPASWCEIHHVTEHAQGGPTHTDNGVPLCWWHHRSLGTSGWEIRMINGIPEVRGPSWWDPAQKWRTPQLSLPTTRRRRHRRRAHQRARSSPDLARTG